MDCLRILLLEDERHMAEMEMIQLMMIKAYRVDNERVDFCDYMAGDAVPVSIPLLQEIFEKWIVYDSDRIKDVGNLCCLPHTNFQLIWI